MQEQHKRIGVACLSCDSISSADMVPIIFVFLCFHQITPLFGNNSFKKLPLPSLGSESYAFDSGNSGPYTGLNDGRIVKFQDSETGFVDFATTTSNRSKELCDGTNGSKMNTTTSLVCGKPIGLAFNHKTNELYIADAYHGLFVVGLGGGVATKLSGGTHFDYADGIDIDPIEGVIYITDLGNVFSQTNRTTGILQGGRLLKYDPHTKKCDVILTGLSMPAGLAVSKDGTFLLISEYSNRRITRFWVKGPKANTSETFLELPGNPDNIKRTKSGDFWVAVVIQEWLPKKIVFPVGQKISAEGQILQTVNFFAEYNAIGITEIHEHLGTYYVASLNTDFVGVYKHLKC